MPQRWENLADKSCKAPGAGLGPKQESDMFPPLPGLGLLVDSPSSLSAFLEMPGSRVVGTLQRDTFPEGTETPPTASPKGPLALELAHPRPLFLHFKLYGVVNGIRHIPSGQNTPGAMGSNWSLNGW